MSKDTPLPPDETPVIAREPIRSETRKGAPVSRGERAKKRRLRLAHIALLLGSLFLISFGYFSWKIGRASRSITLSPGDQGILAETFEGGQSVLSSLANTKRNPLRGERDGRTNILLLGKANEHTAGQKLTDTIMIASLDFSRKKIALLSLPRDLHVTLPDRGLSTKLNAFYQYDLGDNAGAETAKSAVSLVTGLPLHYFLTVDYDGFSDSIDAIGGVSVYVERDLLDTRFPGPNYSYETFEIKKGWRDFDGETALKFVRERHSDPNGDFGRAKRQQDVVAAVRDKMLSLKVLLNPIALSRLIDVAGTHIRTDFSPSDIRHLAEIAETFDTKEFSTAVVDAWKPDSLLRVSHIQVGPIAMFILVPRSGNWDEIHELAENIFDSGALREEAKAVKIENARIGIRNESGNPELSKEIASYLKSDLDLDRVSILPKTSDSVFRVESAVLELGGTRAVRTKDLITRKLSLRDEPFPTIDRDDESAYDIIIFLGKDLADRFSLLRDSTDAFQKADGDPEYERKIRDILSAPEKESAQPSAHTP